MSAKGLFGVGCLIDSCAQLFRHHQSHTGLTGWPTASKLANANGSAGQRLVGELPELDSSAGWATQLVALAIRGHASWGLFRLCGLFGCKLLQLSASPWSDHRRDRAWRSSGSAFGAYGVRHVKSAAVEARPTCRLWLMILVHRLSCSWHLSRGAMGQQGWRGQSKSLQVVC